VVSDGAPGIIRAIEECFPRSTRQRCLAHQEALVPFAKAMFQGLLRIGFRNIHVIVHHQTENFAASMPTDLAFKFAGRLAIFAFPEK
jgi:creatinine amidohydrolase/Fe(II)-dependent formamide hydrolase-like protein